MKVVTFSRIEDLDAQQWNALVRTNYPFLKHQFLAAMEQHKCVGQHVGWQPRHLGCFAGSVLVGAMPLYEKHNSWGEFVFDQSWAQAFQLAGLAYYPKLVNAIPFTPAHGQRILAQPENREQIVEALLSGAQDLMQRHQFSGLHSLFVEPEQFALLKRRGAICRTDCQFHWHNQGYHNFDEFLATLKAKKRKNIRQQRAKVASSEILIRRLDGHTASEQDWHDFTNLYHAIYDRKCGYPAFNQQFFMTLAATMPAQIQLVMAHQKGADSITRPALAAALMYVDDNTLYGRHWGCRGYHDSLHFELCYYQGIEICIERGLQRFDPGAQGEHKIARGFTPTLTCSLHWMADSQFTEAIKKFTQHESVAVQQYINAMQQHSPYQHSDAVQT